MIKIKGKEYVMVNERIQEFRKEHPDYSLVSELVQLTDDACVMKASILNEEGRVLATGYAQEDRTSTMINKTSYVENCETSAWGRALGNLGYGIDTSIASAEEVSMAIAKQDMSEPITAERHSFGDEISAECAECGEGITTKVAEYSTKKYGKPLCYDCQRKVGQ